MKAEFSTITDPNSGEEIQRCSIPDFLVKPIEETFTKHNKLTANFVAASRGHAKALKQFLDLDSQIDKSEANIGKSIQYACKKLKLSQSDPWSYNIRDKKFELRKPPVIKAATVGRE